MGVRLTAAAILAIFVGSGVSPAQDKDDGVIAHEWGAVSVVYGKGAANVRAGGGGSAWGFGELPPFVIRWDEKVKEQLRKRRRIKEAWGGKPVIYFYAGKRTTLDVRVSIPTGRPYAWWPPATGFGPTSDENTKDIGSIKPENGFLEWKGLVVNPGTSGLRDTDGWWAAARKTDSTQVGMGQDTEKFLFYDALMTYEPAVTIAGKPFDAAQGKQGGVELRNNTDEPLLHVWAVRVADGKCRSASSGKLEKGGTATLAPREEAPADLKEVLVASGLYEKEADAFIVAWKDEFFATDGARVLAVLPQEAYDRLLPISIKPAPKELKRVLVLRIEYLDDEGEARVRELIEQLGSDDPAERDTATSKLKAYRPVAEGIFEKALETEKDAERRGRLLKLLGR